MMFSVAMNGSSLRNVLLDDLRVNDQAVRDVDYKVQDRVGRQGKLPAREMRLFAESSSVRSNHWVAAVIAGFSASSDDVACKGADTLAAHRVALVRHGGGADLVLLKRLFHFLQVLQQTRGRSRICAALCAMPRRAFEHLAVKLARSRSVRRRQSTLS